MEEPKNKINVQIPNEKSDVLYSDQVFITSSPVGLVFDFGQFTPQMQTTKIVSRIGMSPLHAKMFLKVLEQNIASYEKQFSPLNITPQIQEELQSRNIGFQK